MPDVRRSHRTQGSENRADRRRASGRRYGYGPQRTQAGARHGAFIGRAYTVTGKPCKHGHISDRSTSGTYCCECDKISSIKYRANYPSRVLATKANYRNGNKDKESARYAKYCKDNKEYTKARHSNYHKKNPDIKFLRNSINRILNNWSGSRTKYEAMLGYTCEELKAHIESQFVGGMSWENRAAFHIDHIIPIAHYLKNGITDPAIINALSNLQPLWATDNLSKGVKMPEHVKKMGGLAGIARTPEEALNLLK